MAILSWSCFRFGSLSVICWPLIQVSFAPSSSMLPPFGTQVLPSPKLVELRGSKNMSFIWSWVELIHNNNHMIVFDEFVWLKIIDAIMYVGIGEYWDHVVKGWCLVYTNLRFGYWWIWTFSIFHLSSIFSLLLLLLLSCYSSLSLLHLLSSHFSLKCKRIFVEYIMLLILSPFLVLSLPLIY